MIVQVTPWDPSSGEPELRVSNSDIQTFKTCRRKWYLGYYRGLRSKNHVSTGPLALGTRVHAALEGMYSDGRDPIEVHAELLQKDREALVFEGRDITELENEGDLGRIMLEGYIEWIEENGIDEGLEVVAAEQIMRAMIMDGRVELIGKLDLRVRRTIDGVRLYRDFKTAGNFADFTKLAHMDEQMLFYHLLELLKLDESERCDGGMFTLLRKVKRTSSARPPFYDQVEVRHNKTQIANFWGRTYYTVVQMLQLKELLDAGHSPAQVAYPTPTRNCSWQCPFVQVCPMFDDGSGAERYVEDFFEVGDPHDRYDQDKDKVIA